jgi:hypothetical protein
MHGVVVKNDANDCFHHVVFHPREFSSGLHVFHEVLHIALELGDSGLANRLGLIGDVLRRARMGASEAITSFFDPHKADCDPGRLRR